MTSIEPRIAIISAILAPLRIWGNICRLFKSAALILNLHGVTSLFPWINTPISPLPDSNLVYNSPLGILKVGATFKIPNGELYTRVESGKGEIGVFIQGNNEVTPWRFKIRAADLNNLQILPHILKGAKIADIMAILGSIDVIMGSVDR